MTEGNHTRGSLISVMTQKKVKFNTGIRLRSRAMRFEGTVLEKLRAKVSKQRTETECMKKELLEMNAKLEEMESEDAGMFEEKKKLTIEENVALNVYYMLLLAFLCIGNGGADY